MADIAGRLSDIHRRHGSGAIGWYYGNPGAFSYSHTLSLNTFMVGFGPRMHVFTAGSQDINNRFVASQLLYGSPLALPMPDVLRTDLLVVIGANPIVSHGSVLTVPRIKDRMHDIVKRGGRVLVIDPRRTETAAQFEWLGIIPDGDAYLLLSLLHVLFGENLTDRARLARQADGAVWLEQLAGRSARRPPRRAPASTRTPCGHWPATLPARRRAAVYGRVGTSTGENGTLTTYLLDAVNLVAGNIDVPGGSMFGSFGMPGRALGDEGSRRGAACQLRPQAIPDRRLPFGADVGAGGRDGQGDHHTGARPGPCAVRQRGQPGAFGAQRRRIGRSDWTAWI